MITLQWCTTSLARFVQGSTALLYAALSTPCDVSQCERRTSLLSLEPSNVKGRLNGVNCYQGEHATNRGYLALPVVVSVCVGERKSVGVTTQHLYLISRKMYVHARPGRTNRLLVADGGDGHTHKYTIRTCQLDIGDTQAYTRRAAGWVFVAGWF